MIKLATVFSGIGAIEHALQRMNIDNKIVFACDNGDVEILTKDIGMDLDVIDQELSELYLMIENIQFDDEVESLYKNQLSDMLTQAKKEDYSIMLKLKEIQTPDIETIKSILMTIVNMNGVKSSRLKEYKTFLNELNHGSNEQIKFKHLQLILEVVNDYKKDNKLEDLNNVENYQSSDDIKWNQVSDLLQKEYQFLESVNGKRIIRKVQDLSQRTSQLHEKINYLKVQKHLESLGTNWKKRKEYVDSLYAGQEKRNKVKQSYMQITIWMKLISIGMWRS